VDWPSTTFPVWLRADTWCFDSPVGASCRPRSSTAQWKNTVILNQNGFNWKCNRGPVFTRDSYAKRVLAIVEASVCVCLPHCVIVSKRCHLWWRNLHWGHTAKTLVFWNKISCCFDNDSCALMQLQSVTDIVDTHSYRYTQTDTPADASTIANAVACNLCRDIQCINRSRS